VFLLTTVSAYVPPPGGFEPDLHLNPGLVLNTFCVCDTGATQTCVDSNGCAGEQQCKSTSSCIAAYSCDEDGTCQSTKDVCKSMCSFSKSMCESTPCGGFLGDCPDCDTPYNNCIDGCDSDYNDCAECGGYWETCMPSNPCCGVMCAGNEECDGGSCVCADTTERCGADGTGDGLDNDCDGDTDEGCASCVADTSQACIRDGCAGSQTCKATGEWGLCHKSDACCGVTCAPNKECDASSGDCVCKDTVEKCNVDGTGDSIDNNCNGQVDEGCSSGAAVACPADAKLCPDGVTVVGRVAPTCSFATCPNAAANGTGPSGTGPSGTGPQGGGNATGPGTGTGGTGSGTGLGSNVPGGGTSSGGADMNLVMILIIVVVAGIMGLIAILLLKRKPQAAPAQPKV